MQLKLVLFTFLCFQCVVAKAQVWCPAGATWHYGYNGAWSTGYYKVEYKGDTVISSVICKIMSKTHYSYSYPNNTLDTTYLTDEYTYSDSNKVYIFRFNAFYILYDFSANVGDMWNIAGTNQYSSSSCDSTGFVKVDSIGTMVINGQSLRFISVSPVLNSQWGWSCRIAEKIGPIINYPNGIGVYNYLFPSNLYYCGMQLDELYEGGKLRCYQDNAFGFFSTGIVSNCSYLATSIKENKTGICQFVIAPNPFNNETEIKYSIFKKYKNAELIICNLIGQKLQSTQLSHSEGIIELKRDNLESGIYLCLLLLDGNVATQKKIVIQ